MARGGGGCNRLDRERKEESHHGVKKREREKKKKAGRQANGFSPGTLLPSQEETATVPEKVPSPAGTLIYEDLPPLLSVKLLTESADLPQQRIPHRCSLIVFCKQNACCLVTFHLSLTFSKSYCYQIRFTLSSCDYCNLLNPRVHPSGRGKVVVSGESTVIPQIYKAWSRLGVLCLATDSSSSGRTLFPLTLVLGSTRQTGTFQCPSG
jgi:hypothetical protein